MYSLSLTKNYTIISIVSLLAIFVSSEAFSCTIKMGYRSNERLPLIAKAPFNTGLYQHLYTQAAKKIGCDLEVVRGPKKRILQALRKGRIDFYPGFNYSEKRAKSVYYIENGLPGGDVGISRLSLPNVTNLSQLKGLSYLTALGAKNFLTGVSGVNVRKIKSLSVGRAIALIQKKRGDFYIYNKSTIGYYLSKNKTENIKIHADCCGGIKPLYLGFSKKSSHFKSENNAHFEQGQPQTIFNNSVKLNADSVAYKFAQALKEMNVNGTTKTLYEQYYK